MDVKSWSTAPNVELRMRTTRQYVRNAKHHCNFLGAKGDLALIKVALGHANIAVGTSASTFHTGAQ